MTTIDFTRIRSAPKSKNDSFEALSVQLFRMTCQVPEDSTFISLRGDGGDGGVEAYFRTASGNVLGVQAKYFFQLGSSELTQINNSLETAISNHPSLTDYWVYIPFNLTGRVAAGRRGKSQAERFEEWKSQKEAHAKSQGYSLKITLCSAAEIQKQLIRIDPHGGMRRYWFDESIITDNQIQHYLNEAMAFAGPRYTASIDVVTSAHVGLDFFGGIGDFQAWREDSLAPVISELRSLKGWGDKSLDILGETNAQAARNFIDQIIIKCDGMKDISRTALEIKSTCQDLDGLLPLFIKARQAQEDAFYQKYGQENDTPNFRQFHAEYMCNFPAGEMDAARKWEEQAQLLQTVLTSQEVGAATTSSLLLVGPAGIGKTHAIVSAAFRRFARGGYSLVVFGDDFGHAEPWEVIRSKLGLGADVARSTLLECLQACADNTGLPFVIYIDALNESPQEARWKNKLPELLVQCSPYAGIKICVSTRDTYKNLVVDSRFPGFAFEHVGFTGCEFEAVQAFATYYGLDAEITPLFSPELTNPLFLHLACKTLKEEGRNSLDVSLPGFVALLEGHLKHCDDLVRDRLKYSNPRNIVYAAMMRLADVLTNNLSQERTWDACTEALKNLAGAEFSPERLLKELEHEGLIILSEGKADTWLVRMGYQRYGDVLRATSLVNSVIGSSGIDIVALVDKLRTLTEEDYGLMEALATVLPEKVGIEITSEKLGLNPEYAYQLFINALAWRSRASITSEIDEHIYGALNTPDLWPQVYEVLVRLSLVPGHHLNASNWFDVFLQKKSMVNRDAFLSIAMFKSFDSKGAVWSLINATLRADIQRWPEESLRLAVITLAWLTSCSDRRIRDLSAKGIARFVAFQPNLGRWLADEFYWCDDDYIIESISLAIYSACLLERGRQKDFATALEGLLDWAFDTPNVLVRDSIRLLGSLLRADDLSPDLVKRLDAFPSKVPAPIIWPTLNDAKPLMELDGLPMNMKLYSSGLQPDFWRYQVEPKIGDFDLESSGISYENLASWLMVETLKFGYPGRDGCALNADRIISSEFGNGRGRKGFADRLGKKYYWILLHRLVGLLSDNVQSKVSYSGTKLSKERFWSLDCRKVDLTDVRDISPSREYPDEVICGPRYVFPDRTGNIMKWVLSDDFTSHGECIVRTSSEGDKWVALSFGVSDNDRLHGDSSWNKPYLALDLFYTSIFIDGDLPAFGQDNSERDVFDNQRPSYYRGYLAEYPDGSVFDQASEEGDFYTGPKGREFSEVMLLRGSEWEYDYSYTTPERQDHFVVPCQDVVKILALKWDKQRGWVDSNGELVVFESRTKGRSGLFIRRSSLNNYLSMTGRKLVYRRFVNRGFFTNHDSGSSQIDILTWLIYRDNNDPEILASKERPFNCEGTVTDEMQNKKFPF